MTNAVSIRVLPAGEGETSTLGGKRTRFMIDGADSGSRFALMELLFEPRGLAAPMHRHHHEDEYTYVLAGRIGAVIEGREVEAGPGDLLFKPRGQWHTFWNAGDDPASCLELISPSGLEELFKSFASLTGEPAPEQLTELAAKYGTEIDFPATFPVVQRHGLSF